MKKSVCSFVAILLCAFLIFMFAGCGGATGPTASMTPPDNSGNGGGSGGSGGGGGGSTPTSAQVMVLTGLEPELPAPRSDVLLYSVDSASGQLKSMPSNLFVHIPGGVIVNPAGTFMVHLDLVDYTTYAIQNGNLGPPVFTSSTRAAFAHTPLMHPSGKYFYAGSQSGIIGFQLADNGSFSQLSTPATPDSSLFAIHPSGNFMYGMTHDNTGVNGNTQNFVMGYFIDQNTGKVTPIPDMPIKIGNVTTIKPAMDPAGRFIFFADTQAQIISTYMIDQSSGRLFFVSNQSTGGFSPLGIAVTSNGGFLYAAVNLIGHTPAEAIILGYSIAKDGTLTPLNNRAPLGTTSGFGMQAIASDLSGKFLYTVNGSQIQGWTIQSNGSLNALGQAGSTPFPFESVLLSFANFKK